MQEAQIVELVTPDALPMTHKAMIFLLSNIAAFAASTFVERGYIGGIAAWRQYKANSAK